MFARAADGVIIFYSIFVFSNAVSDGENPRSAEGGFVSPLRLRFLPLTARLPAQRMERFFSTASMNDWLPALCGVSVDYDG